MAYDNALARFRVGERAKAWEANQKKILGITSKVMGNLTKSRSELERLQVERDNLARQGYSPMNLSGRDESIRRLQKDIADDEAYLVEIGQLDAEANQWRERAEAPGALQGQREHEKEVERIKVGTNLTNAQKIQQESAKSQIKDNDEIIRSFQQQIPLPDTGVPATAEEASTAKKANENLYKTVEGFSATETAPQTSPIYKYRNQEGTFSATNVPETLMGQIEQFKEPTAPDTGTLEDMTGLVERYNNLPTDQQTQLKRGLEVAKSTGELSEQDYNAIMSELGKTTAVPEVKTAPETTAMTTPKTISTPWTALKEYRVKSHIQQAIKKGTPFNKWLEDTKKLYKFSDSDLEIVKEIWNQELRAS